MTTTTTCNICDDFAREHAANCDGSVYEHEGRFYRLRRHAGGRMVSPSWECLDVPDGYISGIFSSLARAVAASERSYATEAEARAAFAPAAKCDRHTVRLDPITGERVDA